MQSQSFTTCSRVQGEDKNNIDLRISNQKKKKIKFNSNDQQILYFKYSFFGIDQSHMISSRHRWLILTSSASLKIPPVTPAWCLPHTHDWVLLNLCKGPTLFLTQLLGPLLDLNDYLFTSSRHRPIVDEFLMLVTNPHSLCLVTTAPKQLRLNDDSRQQLLLDAAPSDAHDWILLTLCQGPYSLSDTQFSALISIKW